MSLDVYLTLPGHKKKKGSGIFVRENGATREITREQWDAKFPGMEPVLAIGLGTSESGEAFSSNITHNLGKMAMAAGIYKALWRPEEIGIKKAGQLIDPLQTGLSALKSDPEKFSKFNADNGWGTYKDFVPFVENYLQACRQFPDAEVSVSR